MLNKSRQPSKKSQILPSIKLLFLLSIQVRAIASGICLRLKHPHFGSLKTVPSNNADKIVGYTMRMGARLWKLQQNAITMMEGLNKIQRRGSSTSLN